MEAVPIKQSTEFRGRQIAHNLAVERVSFPAMNMHVIDNRD